MSDIVSIDKNLIWHPFTQEKSALPNIPIASAKGSYIYDESGNSYLDLISSWWVNLHGHANLEIAQSIYDQALKLEHIIFAGFTHLPAAHLCQELSNVIPEALCKFFFSDNGSTAVEVALKMAYQYWHNNKQTDKKIFLSFDGAYHGDTFGAMAVGAKSGFHQPFESLLFKVLSIPYPTTWDDIDAGELDIAERQSFDALEQYLSDYAQKIAAIILEPIIQGASGMRICRPQFLKRVIERVRKDDILVIFDEVMTGFARTGSFFAFQQIDVLPDFLCLSKGITGGFLPLALTVTNKNIYSAFLHDRSEYAFAHGHSYTANPLACAAAIKSLEILQRPSTWDSITAINSVHKQGLALLKHKCSNVEHTRSIGTIAAFEVKNLAADFKQKCMQKGLLVRPLGRTVYFLPPYSTTQLQLEQAYETICKLLI